MKDKTLYLFFIIFVVCLGILLLINLGKVPFVIDESLGVSHIKGLMSYFSVPSSDSPESTAFTWRIGGDNFNFEPSLLAYQATGAIFFKIFGISEFSARLPSLISGLSLLLITFLFCKKFYDGKIALITSILLGTSVAFLFYSTQATYIMFSSSLIYVSIYLLIGLFTKDGLWRYILYPISLFFALISHPLAYLVMPISFIIIIYFSNINFWKRNYYRIILTAIIFAVPYILFFIFFHKQLPLFYKLNMANMASASHNLLFYPRIIMHELSGELFEEQITSPLYFSFKWLFFVAGSTLLIIKFIKKDLTAILISILLFLPLSFLLLLDFKNAKYLFLYLLSPISICLALGIVQVSSVTKNFQNTIAILFLVAAILLPSILLGSGMQFKQIECYKNLFLPPVDNFQAMRFQYEFLNKHVREGDIIIATLDDTGLRYYTKKRIHGFLDPDNSDEFFMYIVENTPRVWVVDSLPLFDFCSNINPVTGEYEIISAMEKYSKFINYYRNRGKLVARNSQLSIYLCE